MEYNFKEIEGRSSLYWENHEVYAVHNPQPGADTKPKCYILDMFPYPSGSGLHVGHPVGYIASDIYARYKRQRGYNVLHPMGFDAFGLPAEQYALEHGLHPANTTKQNIARYKEQLYQIGFCYDWNREVRTSDPQYYQWTQWIFLQLFNSWYDRKQDKTRPIAELEAILEAQGNAGYENEMPTIDAATWRSYSEKEKRAFLMEYRIAFSAYSEVWWCEALGTVLANDEVINGVSERGGHPVEKKKLKQWFLRITEYANRLLNDLDTLEWSDAMKEMQRNWIGKSKGALVTFNTEINKPIEVFTTRPDTIFGADFLVIAPEHPLVADLTTAAQQEAIDAYLKYTKSRSERDRLSQVKVVTGCFTGSYAIHPFTGAPLPIWIAEYVLMGYGTGAIMAVPAGDERDHAFATHFNIPITNIFGELYTGSEAYTQKNAILTNSSFLTGLTANEAILVAIDEIEKRGLGSPKTQFRLRNAGLSRQRYWGEPFPIIYKNDIAYTVYELEGQLDKEVLQLPVQLPYVERYAAGPGGASPLANIREWVEVGSNGTDTYLRETDTMPGYAGSSWYFLRYMDPHNNNAIASADAINYWQQVDLYVGGTEHAVGHLLYARMWTKALYDLGYLPFHEPFKKLLNQGMIQGSSRYVYRVKNTNTYVSFGLKDSYETTPLHVDVNIVNGLILDTNAFKASRPDYANAEFITEDGEYICGAEIEKMSKSMYNVVNPDAIVARYGADTFRMYEMFLGPVEASKPWDTNGIEGVFRFVKKFWRLFFNEEGIFYLSADQPTSDELKILHKTIKKLREDIERFAYNTCISQMMITVNELGALRCNKRTILEPLVAAISPFAPFMAEELWHLMGNEGSVTFAPYPEHDEQYLVESTKRYPIAINGKTKSEIELAIDISEDELKAMVTALPQMEQWLGGKALKKLIFVKGKMINIVA
ncbi:MAG: leucine--tRNA ligase [Chitinophagia bacterium]|nr:leucine--tRNA ligase [Chitinophagia bacterium]